MGQNKKADIARERERERLGAWGDERTDFHMLFSFFGMVIDIFFLLSFCKIFVRTVVVYFVKLLHFLASVPVRYSSEMFVSLFRLMHIQTPWFLAVSQLLVANSNY